MDRGLGRNVVEGQGVVVLENPVAGDFATQDLGEDVLVVVHSGFLLWPGGLFDDARGALAAGKFAPNSVRGDIAIGP